MPGHFSARSIKCTVICGHSGDRCLFGLRVMRTVADNKDIKYQTNMLHFPLPLGAAKLVAQSSEDS